MRRPHWFIAPGVLVLALAACSSIDRPDAGDKRLAPAGAVSADQMLMRPTTEGPLVVLTCDFMGTVTRSGIDTAPIVIYIPAGVPLQFCWSADVSASGGTARDARYAWDIVDVQDPNQWEDAGSAPDGTWVCLETRTFYFGAHTFTVEVADDEGGVTRVRVSLNVVQDVFSLDIRPGVCPNRVNPRSNAALRVALAGSPDLDVHDVDLSTLVLRGAVLDVSGVRPFRSVIEDVTSAAEPGTCECSGRAPDGRDDLVLYFHLQRDVGSIASGGVGDQTRLALEWTAANGLPALAVDCFDVVGGGQGEKPPVVVGADGRSTPSDAAR